MRTSLFPIAVCALLAGAGGSNEVTVSSDNPAISTRDGLVVMGAMRFTGRLITRDAHGAIIGQRSMREGLLDGSARTWYADGRPAEQREYHRGNKVGLHRGWWLNGTRQFECRYRDGLAVGTCTDWYDNRQVATVHRYIAGDEEGLQQGWSVAGALQFSYVRRDGRRYGVVGALKCKPSALPYYGDSLLTPEWLADTSGIHRVDSLSLLDQRGSVVTERMFDGHVTVVTFFYATCKDLCPQLQSKLAAVRAIFAADTIVQLASISVAPDHDTAPILAAYAAANKIDARGWRLLTGSRSAVEHAARDGFFATAPMLRSTTSPHGETIWLLDQSRRIRGIYNGTLPLEARRLTDDIATLEKESAARGG